MCCDHCYCYHGNVCMLTDRLAAKFYLTNNEAIGILTQIENKNVCCVYLIKIRP